jgi:Leu/Phe-tRNA-protein transferase
VLKRRAHLVGQPFGIAPGGAFPGELLQRLLRRERRIGALLGILIGQLFKAEAAALVDLDRAR